MFAKVLSSVVVGLDGVLIEVETDISNGLPSFTIVGLADRAVEESRERVKSAIRNSGADLPARRITVNLAPGDLPKEGPSFDLPIAVSILLSSGQLSADLAKSMFLGELSLDGKLRSTRGVLPMVLLAKVSGIENVFVPYDNADEASLVDGVSVFPARELKEIFFHLSGQKLITRRAGAGMLLDAKSAYDVDMADIRGQEFVKRAIEVAVSGGHNIHLKGPPGAGKTLIAKAVPSILPPLTFEEALEVTKIYSISGMLQNNGSLLHARPFRNPHHTISHVGLIGGSANPRPGEVSLAHRGVLFLDEFPEFPRQVLEAMRQPMEDGVVSISRAKRHVTYPSSFMLVASSNPCPCGFLGDVTKSCSCSTSQILRYQKRVSGPLVDRIDIHVDVPAVEIEKITSSDEAGESSEVVRKRVGAAHDLQRERFFGSGVYFNSEIGSRNIENRCKVNTEAKSVLVQAMKKLSLSARSYHKIIKVSRTIADLQARDTVEKHHVLEALQYRPKDQLLS